MEEASSADFLLLIPIYLWGGGGSPAKEGTNLYMTLKYRQIVCKVISCFVSRSKGQVHTQCINKL